MSDDFTMPWSAADVAKALRETLGASRAWLGLFRDIGKAVEYRNARQAAGNVSGLGFGPDGMKRPLERIARGEGSPEDIEAISHMFYESAIRVQKSIIRLRRYREEFREQVGLRTTFDLYDEIICGREHGKETIRNKIRDLITFTQAVSFDMALAQERAAETIYMVENFNEQLSRLHDLILPPKQKVRLKRAKAGKA